MKTLKKLSEATLILCVSLLLLSVWWAIPAHTGEKIHRVLEAPKHSAEYKLGPKDPPVDVKLEGWYCGSIDYGTKLPEESERLEKHMDTLEYRLTHEFFPWELVDPRTYYHSSDEAYERSLKNYLPAEMIEKRLKKAVKRYNDSIKGLKIWGFQQLFKLWKTSPVIGPYDSPVGETKTYKYPSFLYRLCWSSDSLSILRENLAIQTISYNELLNGFPFVIAVHMQDSLEKLNPNLIKDLEASRLKPVFSDITPSDIKLLSKAEGTKITIKVGREKGEKIEKEKKVVTGPGKTIPKDITIEGKKAPQKPAVPKKEVSEGKISSKTGSACEFWKPQIIGAGMPGLEGLPPNFPLPPGIKNPWKYEVARGSLYAIGISAGWKDTVNFVRKALRKHGWRITKETTTQDPNVNTSWVHLFFNNRDYCGWVSIGTTVPEAPTPTSMNIGFEKHRN